MSILLQRLLQQAESSLAAGAANDAETTCCQVLTGAATLGNLPLIRDSSALLRRIPVNDPQQRRAAIWQLDTRITAMQKSADREGMIALCDELLRLTEEIPDMHLRAVNIALYVTGGNGMFTDRHPAYLQYLEQLLAYERSRPEAVPAELPPVERSVAEGTNASYQSLAQRGTVIIRGLFDAAQLEPWGRAASAFFDRDPAQATNLRTLGEPAALMEGESGSFLTTVMRQFFLYKPQMSIAHCFVRRVEPRFRESAVPFHQDLNAFGRLMVNVWTPLVACGGDAPGIEVVTRRTPMLMETVPARSQYDELQISEDLIRERFGDESRLRPEMEPGDVLILLGTTIHRTHMTPAMSKRRLSMELRFAVE